MAIDFSPAPLRFLVTRLRMPSPERPATYSSGPAKPIAEEMSLQDLRKARKRTQARVVKELGIKPENVSRIEIRADRLISTLSGYVEAMGGKLHLVAAFPDRPPPTLSGIGFLDEKVRRSKQ